MAKKALISTLEPWGNPDNLGLRVLEVVEAGQEFEVQPAFEWHDCPDHVISFGYYYKDGVFKVLPDTVPKVGELNRDANNVFTQEWVWDWNTESWSIVDIPQT